MIRQVVGTAKQHPASFRDPSGVVFRGEDGTLLRQVNRCYAGDYRCLIDSGLSARLAKDGLLVEHDEVDRSHALDDQAYCVIRPRELPFISYPYEWCFSGLQEAALLTLRIQRRAMQHGMSLKDASAFNVQFIGTSPVFIDTLSFEEYQAGSPWVAYGQFCRHFLAPLALLSHVSMRLNRLLAVYLDGFPLDVASKMLPWRTRLRFGVLMHLHLHARYVKAYSDTSKAKAANGKQRQLSPKGLLLLLDNLAKTVSELSPRAGGTEWADYYVNNSYSSRGFGQKRAAVTAYLKRMKPKIVWDLGANTGVFSRLAAQHGARVYAFDIDPECVETGFQQCRQNRQGSVLPLCLDLTNPSPAIGWENQERQSLAARGPADLVIALALIHHLGIANNLPFELIAQFFSKLGRSLIIEFVPKTDPQVQRLLQSRKDIFNSYDQDSFEAAFRHHFAIRDRQEVGEDGRVLYLLEANGQFADRHEASALPSVRPIG